ncbi:hypothetical protein [Shewanella indica]|uniref:O-antigen ligase family protein n=1 Tax=Shewanella indica TaxID=768528 RepID=UPI003005E982
MPKYIYHMLSLIILISAFIPFLRHIHAYMPALKDLLCIILIFILVIKALNHFKNSRKISSTALLSLFCILYFSLHIVSVASLENIIEDFRFQVFYLILFSLLIVCYEKVDLKFIHFFSWTMFIACFFVLLISIFEYYDQGFIFKIYGSYKEDMDNTRLSYGYRLISTMNNPINYAFFIIFLIPLSSFVFYKTKYHSLVYLFFTILVGLGVLLSYSRLAVIALILVFAMYLMREVVRNTFLAIFTIALALILSFSFVASFLSENITVIERAMQVISLDTYVQNSRVDNWLSGMGNLDNILYVLWGLGLGVARPSGDDAIVVENAFISIFINFGLIGFIIYLYFFVMGFYNAFYVLKKHREHRYSFLFLSVFSVLFVMSTGNDINRNYPFSFIFWVFVYFSFSFRKLMDNK